MPEAEADRVPELYRAHLAALGTRLPSDARRLWTEVSLHDGLVRAMELDESRLRVLFRAGDRQSGYIDAGLNYGDVTLSLADQEFLRSAVGRRNIELLYDEFDSSGEQWVHRLLFWPYREVSIYFEAFTLDVRAASGRFENDVENRGRLNRE